MTTLINGLLPPPKQIRFVNNQGQPPSKRRRINAACLTCRKRKTRCAGERPTCSTCTKNGHVCQGYSEPIDRKKESALSGFGQGKREGSRRESIDDAYHGYDDDDNDERRHSKGRNAGRSFPFVKDSAAGPSRIRPSDSIISGGHPRQDWNEKGGGGGGGGTSSLKRSYSMSEEHPQPAQPGPTHSESHRVPYFRYFGPTAIVPGFKQMVVAVKDRKRSMAGLWSSTSPSSHGGYQPMGRHLSHPESDLDPQGDLPVYDPNDLAPISTLIVDLVKTFFLHLGANFPFWKEKKFVRLVEEKQVEPIIVDTVCALAARYSESPRMTHISNGRLSKWKHGNFFAQRAKERVVDSYAAPCLATVQAFLLLAYEAFGANQDSALWMFLGNAIRMTVDLGLPKLIGIKYQGEKDPWNTRSTRRSSEEGLTEEMEDEILTPDEQAEVEQERIDTVWSILVLDRAVSAGTGRLITLKSEDIELPLPDKSPDLGQWPDPYPPFVHILHLYGRALDVLNNITRPEDLTQEIMKSLAIMESDLTEIYHKQDSRLRFDVNNFTEHARIQQGPSFILLHLWFHALIIILHQPTLLKPFRNSRMHQLAPKSHELAMSSAKTISDILAFSDLIDPHSFIGIPFTSQPMYIAACAFLMESSLTASQPPSPSREPSPPPTDPRLKAGAPDGSSTKSHSLLVSKANDNYRRCYNSLQKLNEYWGGVRYILTALDQKSKGIWDCETYTTEEYESTKLPRRGSSGRLPRFEVNSSSPRDPAIAYSMTGTTNSPNPSVTRLLFQSVSRATPQPLATHPPPYPEYPASTPAHAPAPPPPALVSAPTPPGNMIYDPIRQSLPDAPVAMFPPAYPQPATSAVRHSIHPPKSHRLSTSSIGSIHSQQSSKTPSHMRYEGQIAEDMEVSPSDVKMQHMLGTMAGSSTSQPQLPPHQPHHTFTPTSQHSSGYEASIAVPGASPASTAHTDHHQHLQPHQHQHQHQQHHQQQHHNLHQHQHPHHNNANTGTNSNASTGGTAGTTGTTATSVGGGPDFAQSGLASGSYYMAPATGGPLTDIVSFDSQEVDISTLSLPGGDMSSWYLPGDVVGYIEAGGTGEG